MSVTDGRRLQLTHTDTSKHDTFTDLELAAGKLNDQGIHECEVWTRDAEGEKQWKRCRKNPGHFQFIPVRQFSLEHLPEAFQDEEVFEYVSMMIERTTRLVVKYTSLHRPPGYPFHKYRGTHISHTGSGLIYCYEYDCDNYSEDDDTGNVDDISVGEMTKGTNSTVERNCEVGGLNLEAKESNDVDDDDDDGDFKIYEYFDLQLNPCPCPECLQSEKPRQQWGYVYVFTAKHVVYDSFEANNTIVEINFDDASDNRDVKRLYGIDATSVNNREEWTSVKCVTHDRDLWVKLYETHGHMQELKDTVHEKYWESPSRLCLIVSHPHGWTKQVTVGEWINRKVLQVDGNEDELSEYTYNTATCEGSSGASVLILGMRGSDPGHKTWVAHHHVHSGSVGKNRNISGVESERKVDLDDQTECDCDDDDDDNDAADNDAGCGRVRRTESDHESSSSSSFLILPSSVVGRNNLRSSA